MPNKWLSHKHWSTVVVIDYQHHHQKKGLQEEQNVFFLFICFYKLQISSVCLPFTSSIQRDRGLALNQMDSMTDNLFKHMFHVDHATFDNILTLYPH